MMTMLSIVLGGQPTPRYVLRLAMLNKAPVNQRLDGGEADESFAGAGATSQLYEGVGWNTRMVQPIHQEMEEVDLEPHSHQRQSGSSIDLGAVSKIEDPLSPLSPSNIHPTLRKPKSSPATLSDATQTKSVLK